MVAEDNISNASHCLTRRSCCKIRIGLDWNRLDSWNVDWNRHLVPETSLELIELSSMNKVSFV